MNKTVDRKAPTMEISPTCAQMIAMQHRLERRIHWAYTFAGGAALAAVAAVVVCVALWSIHRDDVLELREQVFKIHTPG